MKFNYLRYLSHSGPTTPTGVLYRPVIPLQLGGNLGRFSTSALVDPGSDETLLPLSVGQIVGANIDRTQNWQVEGIGSQAMPVTLGELEFELTDGNRTFHWSAKVGLVDFARPEDEVTILGHAGFLNYFRVIFDGHQRTLEIDITPAFPGQVF